MRRLRAAHEIVKTLSEATDTCCTNQRKVNQTLPCFHTRVSFGDRASQKSMLCLTTAQKDKIQKQPVAVAETFSDEKEILFFRLKN